jgi:predicted small secreted protein
MCIRSSCTGDPIGQFSNPAKESRGGIVLKTMRVALLLSAIALSACGTLGGISRGIGEAAGGVGQDFTKAGEWIGGV